MRRQHVIVGTLILAGSAAIAVSVLLPTPGVIPAQAQETTAKSKQAGRVTTRTLLPPLPPVPPPQPDLVPLDPYQALGS